MLYDKHMDEGNSLLRKGKFGAAAAEFGKAYKRAMTPTQVASALQMQGVALRMAYCFGDSEDILRNASLEADAIVDDHERAVKVAAIERDMAMLILDIARYERPKCFAAALETAERAAKALFELEEELEHFATHGFVGRVHLERGNKTLALRYLLEADDALREKHDQWELNNLFWVMRASTWRRWAELRRALRLISVTGDKRRHKELLILLSTGNFGYKMVAKILYWHRKPKNKRPFITQ